MKKLLILFLIILNSISLKAQEDKYFTKETCYCAIALPNRQYTKRQKTLIKTKVFKVPCPKGSQVAILSDLKKQFFYFMHKNYRSILEIYKGDKVTGSMLEPLVRDTKEKVIEVINKRYDDKWKKWGYKLIIIDDFEYEKGKYYFINYPGNKLYKIVMEMDDYFMRGIDIK